MFRDDSELPKVSEAVHRLVHRALALDGTCAYAFLANSTWI